MRIAALQGMGGVGKTVALTSLCHDSEVRVAFPGGVLWADVGQQPDLLSLLAGWFHALGGDPRLPLTSAETIDRHLRTLLNDRRVLLVADDVWETSHAELFAVGGSGCRLLFTTREARIAGAVHAEVLEVGVMTQEQSLELMARRLDRPIRAEELGPATEVVGEVGRLPLALLLAASQVARGLSWGELLGDLKAEVARIETLAERGADREPEGRRSRFSLEASLDVSVRRLDDETRTRFAWLGVLAEGVKVTRVVAKTLWGTAERRAQVTLADLSEMSLLLPVEESPEGRLTYRIHGLVRDRARRLLVAPAHPASPEALSGVGLPLQRAHGLLLDRYRAQTQGGLWHTLPGDDGYLLNHPRLPTPGGRPSGARA
jgi:hypothetical protein